MSRLVGTVRDYLPTGNTLDDETFRSRHLLLCWILGLHVPALFAFGVWRGYGVAHSALEVVTPAACLVLARLARNRRVAAFFVTAGLVFCSSVIVHLSGGTIEAHFHFFVLIGLIGLYQDWVPFLWNVVFTVLSHGIGSSIGATLMFNHPAAQNRPWSWAVIHGVSVLAACVGVIIFWKNTELEQNRSTRLVAELSASELAAAQAEAARRRSVSELFVNLARRNQSLLDRQLGLIAELEQRERQPEALAELFQLDHLATRIRRNAESLLVLSGDDPPRRWGRPVPLAEVVRAAAAEVEDYGRVEVMVSDHLEVAGRVVADLAHLLAELIENATTFSPPGSEVRVRSHLAPAEWSTYVISVEDTGIGMPDDDLRVANTLLSEPPEVDLTRSTLGFHVVGRLAKRYGLEVRLAHTPGGGVTALVTVPNDIVGESRLLGAGPQTSAPTRTAAARATSAPIRTIPDTEPLVRPAIRPSVEASLHRQDVPALPRRSINGRSARTASTPPGPGAAPGMPTLRSATTPEGLARRVPGAGLGALRRPRGAPGAPAGVPAANGAGPPTPPGPQGAPSVPEPPESLGPLGSPTRDREQRRAMLSQFQASQRAGRAAARRPDDARTPEEEA